MAITRVQGTARGQNQSTTVTATLTSTPTADNFLVAVISADNTGGEVNRIVSSITQTNVSWSMQVQKTVGYFTLEIWLGVVSASAGKSVQANFSGNVATLAVINVCEYSGLASSGTLDKTASSSGSGTTTDTGTTATTTHANELWIGGTHSQSWGIVQSSPTNGFTLLDGDYESYWSGSQAYLEKIVSSTGTANTGTTTGSYPWVGAIATFKAASIGIQLFTLLNEMGY